MNLLPSGSTSFALDRTLLSRWLRATAIIALPAVVVVLSALQSGDTISLDLFFGTLLASALDFFRRYATDYSRSDDTWNQS